MELFVVTPLHTIWAGREAVLLFFVLSGFVLSIPFFNGRKLNYTSYVIRRFFRIYIPYIVIMMTSVLLVMLFHEYKNAEGLSSAYANRWDHEVSFQAIASYILMRTYDITNVNGVVWTLFHEMKISLIFPVFVFIILKFRFFKGLICALGLNVLLYLSLEVIVNTAGDNLISSIINSFKGSLYYGTFFIFGAVLAKYKGKLEFIKVFSAKKKAALLCLSLVLINSKWASVYLNAGEIATDMICLLGILTLFALVINSVRISDILTNKPLLWLGKVSFSLYLIHIPVLMMTTIFLGKVVPIVIAFIFVPVICLPIAHFTYRFLELPANNIGKRLAKMSEKILIFRGSKSA